MPATVESFIAKWAASGASERANKDAYLLELCDALEVPRPNPTKADEDENDYVFEKSATFTHEGGVDTVGKIDLYKAGCFILEAKQGSDDGSKRMGTARRGTPAWNISMKDAYGQALGYARAFDTPVPFLVIADIGYCFDLYAAFDGSWNYRPFPNAQHNRLFHKDLAKHVKLLRQLFLEPGSLDPSKQAAKITKEVATHLAGLAKALEAAGHPQELVATFLMRCLFTMFAEDVGLLPECCFTKAIREYWLPNPPSFPGGIEQLWRTMNSGGEMFGIVGKILKFNGGLFRSPTALPLDKDALKLLLRASECNWAEVEPAIFGTLLERALDSKERHKLGAHFTPRAYVERLVRPTIEEPLRADWDIVQAQVRSLVLEASAEEIEGNAKSFDENAALGPAYHSAKKRSRISREGAQTKKLNEAIGLIQDFQKRLTTVSVLDPACGSGNFLYVTLDLLKQLETDVLAALEALTGRQELLRADTIRVTPAQFHGIEIKRWAKEIAELVLWIGYLQWHFRIHGKSLPVPEPVLRDYKNIECRDAVLAYDGEPELLRDDKGKPITRWDGESTKAHPVTGEQVPNEAGNVPIYTYKNPRKASWPTVDYVVGNPPFVGNKRLKATLGDGYVQAIRHAWPEVPDSVDFVMYWWHHAALLVNAGKVRRAGLITTNSITQSFNRNVITPFLSSARLAFAIPNHPWVDSVGGADVRIAMTVLASSPGTGQLQQVLAEHPGTDGEILVELATSIGVIQSDLHIGIPNAVEIAALRANKGISFMGVTLSGQGFVLEATDPLVSQEPGALRKYIVGNELNQTRRNRYVIDFFGLDDRESLAKFPRSYQRVLDRVRPERAAKAIGGNKDACEYAQYWWLFAKPRDEMRRALIGLTRFIAICRTAKHFVFQFLSIDYLPESKVVAIASDDAFVLGILSSRIHLLWAVRRGSRHGVGNDLTYNNVACFTTFPFPDCNSAKQRCIRVSAESLDNHRTKCQSEFKGLAMTDVYNVLTKIRAGDSLDSSERNIRDQGLVSILLGLHDDLDAAVFDAYDWPHDLTDEQILERLVALNAERAEEERKGHIRWLRPEFQNPGGTKAMTQTKLIATDDEDDDAVAVASTTAATWPKKLPDQIAAVRNLVTSAPSAWTLEQAACTFRGAKAPEVEAVLDSLAALGLVVVFRRKGVRHWKAARFAA